MILSTRTLSILGLSFLVGALASCNQGDTPQLLSSSSETVPFAPRILSPEGGLRQADYVHLQIWSFDQGTWTSVFEKTDISAGMTKFAVNVPRNVRLSYRVAGYTVSLTNGIRQVDTVWSAGKDRVFLTDSLGSDSAGTVARNWAKSPEIPFDTNVSLQAKQTLKFRAAAGERIVVATSAAAAICGATTAADSIATWTVGVDSAVGLYVRGCPVDTATGHASTVRYLTWNIDATSLIQTYTPVLAPSANLLLAPLQANPKSAASLLSPNNPNVGGTVRLAWNLALDTLVRDTPTVASDFPSPPLGLVGANGSSPDSLRVWDTLQHWLASHPQGARVRLSLVAIRTIDNHSWVSDPTYRWFTVRPPEAPQFQLVSPSWDAVEFRWSQALPTGVRLSAWMQAGASKPDTSLAAIPADTLSKASFVHHGFQGGQIVSARLVVRDTLTGLVTESFLSATTAPWPSLPSPQMKPGSGSQLHETDTLALSPTTDPAGQSVAMRYFVKKVVATAVDSSLLTAAGAIWSTSTTRYALPLTGLTGQFLYIGAALVDTVHNRSSDTIHAWIEIAQNTVVLRPESPANLAVVAKTDTSLKATWSKVVDASYQLEITKGGKSTIVDVPDTVQTISGLSGGDSVSIRVRSVSTSLQTSNWTSALTATTRNPPPALTGLNSSWTLSGSTLNLKLNWTTTSGVFYQYWAGEYAGSALPALDTNAFVSVNGGSGSWNASGWTKSNARVVVRSWRDSLYRDTIMNGIAVPVQVTDPVYDTSSTTCWQSADSLRCQAVVPAGLPSDRKLVVKHTTTSSFADVVLSADATRKIFRCAFPIPSTAKSPFSYRFAAVRNTVGLAARDTSTGRLGSIDLLDTTFVTSFVPTTLEIWSYQFGNLDSAKIRVQFTNASGVPFVDQMLGGAGTIRDVSNQYAGSTVRMWHIVPRATGAFADTSVAKVRTIRKLSKPTVSPASGTYLFPMPFTVSYAGTEIRKLETNNTWSPASTTGFLDYGLREQTVFAAGDFAISDEVTFSHQIDSVATVGIWYKRWSDAKKVSFQSGRIIDSTAWFSIASKGGSAVLQIFAYAGKDYLDMPCADSACALQFAVDTAGKGALNWAAAVVSGRSTSQMVSFSGYFENVLSPASVYYLILRSRRSSKVLMYPITGATTTTLSKIVAPTNTDGRLIAPADLIAKKSPEIVGSQITSAEYLDFASEIVSVGLWIYAPDSNGRAQIRTLRAEASAL